MRFEWHDAKAEANLQAHGVSFDLAKTVFNDVFAVERLDDREDYGEERFVIIGMAKGHIMLYIACTERDHAFALFPPGGQPNVSKTIISGKTPSPPKPMTVDAIERAARADRDAQPLTEADLKRMKRTPQAKIIRRALELTQEEFAARYHIPLGTLRDWEQGRAEPDQPTRAYLTLIARDPDGVSRTLNRKELFVVRHDDGWAVKRPDAERSTAVTPTQAEAIERAREMEPGATIHVQNRRGEFRRLSPEPG